MQFEIGRKLNQPILPLSKEFRSLFEFCNSNFEQWSDEELSNHIIENRNKIEKISSWPCCYWFTYLQPKIRSIAPENTYQRLLNELLKNRNLKILDIGCMLGIESRALLQDGVLPNQIICIDIFEEFFKLGMELFKDSIEDFHLKGLIFQKCDFFNENQIKLLKSFTKNNEQGEQDQGQQKEEGYFAILISKFTHLFEFKDQIKIIKNLNFLLSKRLGSTIFGAECGREKGKEGLFNEINFNKVNRGEIINKNSKMFHHSIESLKKLYEISISNKEFNSFEFKIELKKVKPIKGNGEFIIKESKIHSIQTFLRFAIIRK